MSVGSLECWQLQKSTTTNEEGEETEDASYQKLWLRAFKNQAICLTFSPEKNILVAGTDNGEIVPVKVDIENPEEFEELKEYRIHKARIMGLWFDGERNLCYSISEDKHLICFDYKTKTTAASKLNFFLLYQNSYRKYNFHPFLSQITQSNPQ